MGGDNQSSTNRGLRRYARYSSYSDNTSSIEMHVEVIYDPENELLVYKTLFTYITYQIHQTHGQTYIRALDIPKPAQGNEVYAKKIPRDIELDELFRFFAACGQIYEIRVLMDFSGFNRGACYVLYQRLQASRRAICCLNNELLGDYNRVDVKISHNNNKLILKDIPPWISRASLETAIGNIIGDGLDNIFVGKCRDGLMRYCICEYLDHQLAITAYKKAWPYIYIGASAIAIRWTTPELVKYSKKLYFTNFCPNMTKTELFEALIERIDMKTLIELDIRTGHGSITFTNALAMARAERALKGLIVRGFKLQFARGSFQTQSSQSYNQLCEFQARNFYSPAYQLQWFAVHGRYPTIPNESFAAHMRSFTTLERFTSVHSVFG